MADNFNADDELTPKELAKHSRQPDGETGKQVGLKMNKGNKHICLNSYKVLDPEDGNHVLEIGMGNGFFVKDLLKMGKNLKYTGVDFSAIMVQEAKILNRELINDGIVQFKHASIEKLPFNENSFDSITTTNTLYFWPQPIKNVQELLRVLKPNGKVLIAYRSKSYLDQMELTKYGFKKYNIQDVESLLWNARFKKVTTQIIEESELDIHGEIIQIDGLYTTGIK